ncbi:uncharacterized protein LOC124461605 [Drosophila willistoni]|uniref:uncharacterized protein LOC124460814 n=1 Tax=Drosophila willistoni TaxID=7260 RepID=UPI001F087D5A|nr:uncharacterized protein LOC124460814 [Drosophila willistoni]XP_046869078.1 uncharacterized protein LOC124461605 [Drosophila willistoni]
MVPLRKATSVALEKVFRERIWARFGNPRTLVSNNGTQFTSKNPTERANRAIKTMIAQYLENGKNTWDQWLPEITLAINSSVNDTTCFSPAYIILGREPRMPGALYDQVTDVSGNEPPSPDERVRRMEDIFKLVHENQLNATQNQKKYYDLRRRDWRPNIGSMVVLKHHVLSNANEGFNAKLAPKGPYKIIKFLSSNVVRLLVAQKRERRTPGLADLKAFNSDDNEPPELGLSEDIGLETPHTHGPHEATD